MKIATIIGARPQFIKAATVSRLLSQRSDIQEVLIHTGQHYDTNMSAVFFQELDIPEPHYNLAIGSGTHGEMTGRQLEKIEAVLLQEKPDWVLVYGDTNSTLAGALAAAKLHIPVAHIEAGLRSWNRKMPEEINRIVADTLSSLLFTPSDTATNNLFNEGIQESRIKQVGDVMLDACLFYKKKSKKPVWFEKLKLNNDAFVLATIHRAENTDNPQRLTGILEGLGRLHYSVILPLHPRTRKILEAYKLSLPKNLLLVEPVGYLEMIWLTQHAAAVATDSGGLQKEAYFLGTSCITLREETEWTELCALGVNQIVGANPARIKTGLEFVIENAYFNKQMPYGTGNAANQIIEALAKGID